MGEGEYLLNARDVDRVGAEAVHSGVNLDVHVDVPPECREGARVVRLRHRLRETIAREALKALRSCPAEDENDALYTGAPELHALGGAGHGKGPHPAAVEQPRGFHRAVAVGLALEHGHELAAAREDGAQGLRVLPERPGVHLDPGAAPVVRPDRPDAPPDEQYHRRGRRRAEADREIVPHAVFHQRPPKPGHARRAAHEHYHPGVQDVDQQRKWRHPARGLPARD